MAKGAKSKGSGILAFVFILPLLAIIIYVAINSSMMFTLRNVNSITVSSPGRDDCVFDDADDIDFFISTITGALSINSAMRDVSEEEPVYIICSGENNTVEYKFYPSLNLSGCLLVAPEGKLYVLENEKAKQLLLREEFDYLYSEYFLPRLSVVSGDVSRNVDPIEANWTYLKSDDMEYSYVPQSFADGSEEYVIVKGLENTLSFSPENDILPYEISEISFVREKPDGTTDVLNVNDIGDFNYSTDTVIKTSLTVRWSSKNGARAYGEAKYEFNIIYDIPASFTFENDGETRTVGDVFVIRAENLNEDENVELDTLIEVPSDADGKPFIKFDITDEEYRTGIALVPVGLNSSTMTKGNSIKLQTSVASFETEFDIQPVEQTFHSPVSATEEEYNEMLSPEKLAQLSEKLSEITAQRDANNYFVFGSDENLFYRPVSASPAITFGQKITIGFAGSVADSGRQTVNGIIYETDEGADVKSVQKGIVVYSGSLAATGNTVVIYHGYGIYSYYFNLDSIEPDVIVGAETGTRVIGHTGKTGFTAGKTILNFAMSIDGVFVNPECFDLH